MQKLKILVVDCDVLEVANVAGKIRSWGCQVETACEGADALEKCQRFQPHVVLSEIEMPGLDGYGLIQQLAAAGNAPPVILLSRSEEIDKAMAAVREQGAFWFIEKPVQTESLQALILQADAQARMLLENERLRIKVRSGNLGELVGNDPKMEEIFRLISRFGPSRANVLITGESGTGKELVARAIHESSTRASGPFVALNCAALPETLIESELFGHERGSFTGATEKQIGRFELAHGGSLFLDEIAEMPVQMQPKLLRVLEDLRVRRIGGRTDIQVDVRLIAATNRAPQTMIESGLLRKDLYYRIGVLQIHLPPLRERIGDIPLIANSLLSALEMKHESASHPLAPAVMECLTRHSWPGNIRELRNVLERALILAGKNPISVQHLPRAISETACESRCQTPAPPTERSPEGSVVLPLGITMLEAQRRFLKATFQSCGMSTREAARVLDLSLKTVQLHLREIRNGEAKNAKI